MKRWIPALAMTVFGCGGDDGSKVEVRAATSAECASGGTTLVSDGQAFPVCDGDGQGPAGPQGEQGPAGPQGPQGPQGPAGGSAVESPFALGEFAGFVSCNVIAETTLGESFGESIRTWFFTSGWTYSMASLNTADDGESQSDFSLPDLNPTFLFLGAPLLTGVIRFEMNLASGAFVVSQDNTVVTTVPWTDPACLDARM